MRNLVFRIQSAFLDFDRSILPEKKEYLSQGDNQDYLFIIGAPRSGSTALYQAMISQFKLGYLSNLMYLFPSRISTIAKLTKRKILDNTNLKESDLGFINGLNSPSECGRLFSFWFDEGNFDEKREHIANTFRHLKNVFQHPLIFKNLNNSYRIEKIKATLPNSKFIFIKRDPMYTCQSILLSRKKEHNSYRHWWSVKPPGFEKISEETPFVQAAWQVFMIEKAIYESLSKDPSLTTIQYEEFCNSPSLELDRIGEKLNLTAKKRDQPLSRISNNNVIKIKDSEWMELKNAINKFYS